MDFDFVIPNISIDAPISNECVKVSEQLRSVGVSI